MDYVVSHRHERFVPGVGDEEQPERNGRAPHGERDDCVGLVGDGLVLACVRANGGRAGSAKALQRERGGGGIKCSSTI